jgi:hypothetical protein
VFFWQRSFFENTVFFFYSRISAQMLFFSWHSKKLSKISEFRWEKPCFYLPFWLTEKTNRLPWSWPSEKTKIVWNHMLGLRDYSVNPNTVYPQHWNHLITKQFNFWIVNGRLFCFCHSKSAPNIKWPLSWIILIIK